MVPSVVRSLCRGSRGGCTIAAMVIDAVLHALDQLVLVDDVVGRSVSSRLVGHQHRRLNVARLQTILRLAYNRNAWAQVVPELLVAERRILYFLLGRQ